MLTGKNARQGKFAELVHEEGAEGVRENFTLVAKAIPTAAAGRNSAPWFGMAGVPTGPWWNLDAGVPKMSKGYNSQWSVDWELQPTYFGVISSAGADYTYLNPIAPPEIVTGGGDNKTISNIYRWIIKGGIPIAWNSGYRKVGAAWEYANGNMLSRHANSPRIFRLARA